MGKREGALEVMVNAAFWKGKRVFLTGHTGFKGGWLSLWLQSMGAELSGYALAPSTNPSLFDIAHVGKGMASHIGDIRDLENVTRRMTESAPDIVIHMAAQPLVRYSYQAPVETYAVNVMGTVNVLEAARQCSALRSVLVVTSDKCYENREWSWGYRENEAMGGYDPYSNSKGCAELVTSAYRQSFFQKQGVGLASGRAGNVIGGGDWADDRLVPDCLRAFERGEAVTIRNPHAIRPWQHVLEPLGGYLTLVERLWEDSATFDGGWNFGPDPSDAQPVQRIVESLTSQWPHQPGWRLDGADHPHEAHFLKLDISKARQQLQWQPRWKLEKALSMIVEWHRAKLNGADMQRATLEQIRLYAATP